MKDEVEYSLKLPTATGHSSLSLRVPREPMRLADLVPLAQRFTNLVVESSVRLEEREGRAISCRAGCGACCRQIVPVSAPEAFRLADHLIGLDDATRDAFLARFDDVERALDAAGMIARLDALSSGALPAKDRGALAADYFGLTLACPMLIDESCAVHAERPLSCRDYNVTTPAAWCASPPLYQIRKVPTAPLLSEPLARVTAKLTGAAKELIPLSLSLRWVDAHAELGMREWPGTTLFEAWLVELDVAGRA